MSKTNMSTIFLVFRNYIELFGIMLRETTGKIEKRVK